MEARRAELDDLDTPKMTILDELRKLAAEIKEEVKEAKKAVTSHACSAC